MAIPSNIEARRFFRVAMQRVEDARFLLENDRTKGAVYLAGYGVECALKALLLASCSAGRRERLLKSFRGSKANDYGWLRQQYVRISGGRNAIPAHIGRLFAKVSVWGPEMRYEPGAVKLREAEDFLLASEAIVQWANGRM